MYLLNFQTFLHFQTFIGDQCSVVTEYLLYINTINKLRWILLIPVLNLKREAEIGVWSLWGRNVSLSHLLL